ncbi:MAG TPA: helix-turn-helix domain-containing protein [Verrucomicrobiae bacterium]|nr:helix-turn-helix domain-containing protein [Verrucomicrobiae bacterium]
MKDWTPQKIKRLREAAEMTQVRFADWLGVTRVHVAHLEIGVRPAGPQTARLLDILAGRVESGEVKAVQPKQSTKKRRAAE